MTIKIVDDKPDPSVLKEIICKNCGVKLQYTPNDVLSSKVEVSDYDYIHYFIICPNPKCRFRIEFQSI
jgi:uncharacterized protein with PIN domain